MKALKAALMMLDISERIKGRKMPLERGDAQRLESSLFWLRTTNVNRQCIEAVERLQEYAARQEGLPVFPGRTK